MLSYLLSLIYAEGSLVSRVRVLYVEGNGFELWSGSLKVSSVCSFTFKNERHEVIYQQHDKIYKGKYIP